MRFLARGAGCKCQVVSVIFPPTLNEQHCLLRETMFIQVADLNIQGGSRFSITRVSVEVHWLPRPPGIQHLPPFSSELSVFVLHWSHSQDCWLLNAKKKGEKK